MSAGDAGGDWLPPGGFPTANDLLEAVRQVLRRWGRAGDWRIGPASVHDGLLEVAIRRAGDPEPYGVQLQLPDGPAHPTWAEWAPHSLDEWATYAVYHRLVEELDTGLLGRAPRRVVDGVTWLEVPEYS